MLKREWIPLTNEINGAIKTNPISFLTWNTLARQLASSGFSNCDNIENIISWDHRKNKIINVLLEHNYDIICLQEVDEYANFFQPIMDKLGYDSLFCAKFNQFSDGICIFWKRDKFRAIDGTNLRYLNHSQVCLIVVLEVIQDKQRFCVGTTHLKAKNGFEKERLEQATIFMNNLKEMSNKYECPIMLAGDMNDDPNSIAIAEYKKSYTSVYNENNCEWTTWKKRKDVIRKVIDYIFHDSNIVPISILRIPLDKECPLLLPAEYHPSDHMSIGCQFILK